MYKIRKIVLLCLSLSVLIIISGSQKTNQISIFNEDINNNEAISTAADPFNVGLLDITQDDAGSGMDAGNSLAIPYNLTSPGIYNGTLIADDDDYYSININYGTIVNITLEIFNLTIDFDLTFYGTEQTPIASDYKGAGITESLIYSTKSSGKFYLSILPHDIADIGNYTFSITFTQQNDFASDTDAGNDFQESLEISAGTSNGSLVSGSDEDDFYKIAISKGQILSITLESSNETNIDLYLRTINSDQLSSSTRLEGLDESIYYAISETAFYIIHLQFIESTINEEIVDYNLTIVLETQNDANSGTDAGNTAEDAYFIIPLSNSKFNGKLVFQGDERDFYRFEIDTAKILYAVLNLQDAVNFDLKLFDEDKGFIASSEEEYPGGKEAIDNFQLENGTYYISIEFATWEIGDPLSGNYELNIGLLPVEGGNGNTLTVGDIIMMVISYGVFPLAIIIITIFIIHEYTSVRIPGISNWLDKRQNKEGKEETTKSLRYAIKVRDDQIASLREELINKDSKRAKDLETIHRIEEDQKAKDKVITKIRDENAELKTDLKNLSAMSDDLANIIDSTIRRQLAKGSKTVNKAKVSSITSLLWLSEDRLLKYINSTELLNERYILDKNKNFILTKDYAREIVRQAYWKRVGAMHLKKIKQVKVSSLADDTNIDISTLKEILRELVERKEIPAPIHMDRQSLLLSISEELISELADVTQNTAIISLKEVSKSYDTTPESAKVIFEKIAEEGYTNGEFINDDIFIVYNLFTDLVINQGSLEISKLAKEQKLEGAEEDIRILIEKLILEEKLTGQFITDDMFLCFNNLTDQLRNLIIENIDHLNKGETRKVVFDLGSVVESITKEQLIMDIHECNDIDKLPRYQEIIESKELGRILRAAEDSKITLPSNIELKSLNRFWAQKIKHTKPGKLPYTPTKEETQEFLFEANRALNKILGRKIPTKWKKDIAEKLLSD